MKHYYSYHWYHYFDVYRVHSTQGKPGKSGKNLENLQNDNDYAFRNSHYSGMIIEVFNNCPNENV